MNTPNTQALDAARRFHDAYERLAPQFGYETRTDTKAFDPNSANGRLMIAVCRELAALTPSRADTAGAVAWINPETLAELGVCGMGRAQLSTIRTKYETTPLYPAPAGDAQEAVGGLLRAANKLAAAAMTTGGVAGTDPHLQAAIDAFIAARDAAAPTPEAPSGSQAGEVVAYLQRGTLNSATPDDFKRESALRPDDYRDWFPVYTTPTPADSGVHGAGFVPVAWEVEGPADDPGWGPTSEANIAGYRADGIRVRQVYARIEDAQP